MPTSDLGDSSVLDVLPGWLRSRRIDHGPLVQVDPVTNNVSFTDGSKVWVKVSRAGGAEHRFTVEHVMSTYVGMRGLWAPKAAPAPTGLPSGESVAVFRYEPGSAHPAPKMGVDVLNALWSEAVKVHRLPPPSTVGLPDCLTATVSTVRERMGIGGLEG